MGEEPSIEKPELRFGQDRVIKLIESHRERRTDKIYDLTISASVLPTPEIFSSKTIALTQNQLKTAIFDNYGIKSRDNYGIVYGNSTISLLADIIKTKNYSLLIPAPTFGFYVSGVKTEGRDLLVYGSGDGGKITPEQLSKFLTGDSEINGFLFTNPVNPTGTTYNKGEIEALAAVLKNFPQVTIISDEVLSGVIPNETGKNEFCSFATVADENLMKRLYCLSSTKKSLGGSTIVNSDINDNFATAWCVCPKEYASKAINSSSISEMQKQMLYNIMTMTSEVENYKKSSGALYQKNINLVLDWVTKINNTLNQKFNTKNERYLKLYNKSPASGNSLLLDFGELYGLTYYNTNTKTKIVIKSGIDVAEFLFDQCNIMTIPGEGFLCQESEILTRLNISQNEEYTKTALDQAVSAFSKDLIIATTANNGSKVKIEHKYDSKNTNTNTNINTQITIDTASIANRIAEQVAAILLTKERPQSSNLHNNQIVSSVDNKILDSQKQFN